MQPGERPFDPVQPGLGDPAMYTQPAPVRRVAPGEYGLDMTLAQPLSVCFRVVASVALHALRTATRSTPFTPYPWDGVDQCLQLRDIVGIGTGQQGGQRDPMRICDHVVFASRFRFVCRVWPRFGPPFSARKGALSTTARDQHSPEDCTGSIWSAACNRASRTSCKRCHTPAACQSRKRRQQVIPLPQPISCGKSSQPIPVLSTKTIPVSALRLSTGLRPGYRKRRHDPVHSPSHHDAVCT